MLDSIRRLVRPDRNTYEGYFEFGGVPIPWVAATLGTCIVGSPRSGKSLLQEILMFQALPLIGTGAQHRAIVYDSKQNMLSMLHGGITTAPVVNLNPFDARSCGLDLAADLRSPATAMELATILIPEDANASANDSFFTLSSRDLLAAGVMQTFMHLCPGEWQFRDLVVASTSMKWLRLVVEASPERERLLSYFAEGRLGANILATLNARMSAYLPIAGAFYHAKERVSLRDWVAGESVLVLGNNESARAALDAVNRVAMTLISELLLAQPDRDEQAGTHRTWMFLDEAQDFVGPIADIIVRCAAKGRSKQICSVFSYQSTEGFRAAFRRPELADAVTATLNNYAVLRTASSITAEWGSALFGKARVPVITQGQTISMEGNGSSRQMNRQYEDRPVIMPIEFQNIPLTDRRHGLSGFFLTPFTGPFCETLSPAYIDSHRPKRDPGTPDFIERPPDQLYCPPWTATDLARLHLPDPATAKAQAPTTGTTTGQPKTGGGLPNFKKS